MGRLPIALLLAAAAALTLPTTGRAQDIEAMAAAAGRPLPAGYLERIRSQPDFFEIRQGWTARTAQAAVLTAPVSGTLPLVVVSALFADSPPPPFTTEQIQRVLFEGPAEHGTLTEYYAEVSRGRFRVEGQTVPWVRTGLTAAEVVGASYGLGKDARTGEFLVQALTAADSLVDFARFDSDGPDGVPNSGDDDGVVDAVVFQFAERSGHCGGPGIWPHRARVSGWTKAPYTTQDLRPDGTPIQVNDYIVQSAIRCDGVRQQTASVIAHELGHVLGLPDYYDASAGVEPQKRRWVLGCWSLMAGGAWGCRDGGAATEADRPTHMGAYEKLRLGWVEVRALPSAVDQVVELAPVRTSGEVLQIPLGDGAQLLVEHRAREGFDAGLPAGGVLVYHLDPTLPPRPCPTCTPAYRVMLLEADGDGGMLRSALEGGNRGEAGDAFGAAGPGKLTSLTTPSSRRHSGAATPVSLYRIEVVNGAARIHLSTAIIPRERLLQPMLRSAATPLSPAEQAHLDALGNANGRYDIGDLQLYLREHPAAQGGP